MRSGKGQNNNTTGEQLGKNPPPLPSLRVTGWVRGDSLPRGTKGTPGDLVESVRTKPVGLFSRRAVFGMGALRPTLRTQRIPETTGPRGYRVPW